jgi:hypothetical protein
MPNLAETAPRKTPEAFWQGRMCSKGTDSRCAAAARHAGELARLIKESKNYDSGDYLAAARAGFSSKTSDESHPASIASAMRQECVYLLQRVSECYKVSRETVGASVSLMDKTLSKACLITPRDPHFDDLASLCRRAALLSATCFLVTCKFREVLCPLLNDLSGLFGGQFTVQDICQAEVVLLNVVDWDLHTVTAVEICNSIMSAAPPLVRERMQFEAELVAEAATCSKETLCLPAASVAVCSIAIAADRLNIPSECIGFVPRWVIASVDVGAITTMQDLFDSPEQQQHSLSDEDAPAAATPAAPDTHRAPAPGDNSSEPICSASSHPRCISSVVDIDISQEKLDGKSGADSLDRASTSPANCCSLPSAWMPTVGPFTHEFHMEYD